MVIKNRKGDMTAWGVIFSIVLGLLVAWLVYSFATGTFNPFISATKNLPQEAQIAIGVCNGLTEVGDALNNAYCMQARDTSVGDRKVTCGYLNEQKLLTKGMTCTDKSDDIAKKVCIEEFRGKVSAKLYVNNQKCSSLVACADINGEIETTEANCVAKQKSAVKQGLSDLNAGTVCCI
jgi:hypothetical protein